MGTPHHLPSYVVITPARNEAENIEKTIASMRLQRVRPLLWVIVDDGSTDQTSEIVSKYLPEIDWMRLVQRPRRQERTFAGKVHAFNAGAAELKGLSYDLITCMDGDVSFEPEYFEFLLTKFAEDPNLGVAGTIFVENGYSSGADSFEGANHVAGICQVFRRACFEEIGGYTPHAAGGIDWMAVTTARMKGWKTRSFREISCFHHRPIGTAERGRLAALFSYGEKDYYLGGHPVWQLFRCAYRFFKRPFALGGIALGLGYAWAFVRRRHRPVSAELMAFHRREQMSKLKKILGRILRLRRVDNFELAAQ